jgi:hypothetical protein
MLKSKHDQRGNGKLTKAAELLAKENPRLVAAAPDLLAACQSMVEAFNEAEAKRQGVDDEYRALRAAVEKATK